MNRHLVVHEPTTFSQYRKNNRSSSIQNKKKELTIDDIVKIFYDKKNIKDAKKRRFLTKKLFIEYMDDNHNIDEDLL